MYTINTTELDKQTRNFFKKRYITTKDVMENDHVNKSKLLVLFLTQRQTREFAYILIKKMIDNGKFTATEMEKVFINDTVQMIKSLIDGNIHKNHSIRNTETKIRTSRIVPLIKSALIHAIRVCVLPHVYGMGTDVLEDYIKKNKI